MMGCKPISIPSQQNVKLGVDEGDLVEDTTMYKRIVGSLIYMTITRPDFSYVVRVVSQFMQTPQKPHLDAVRRILKYINILCNVEFFMKPRTNYKYLDTWMLIGLAMFQTKNQPMVSFIFLEVMLLVRVIRNNQHLHYQT
jgi:hypothetical protein